MRTIRIKAMRTGVNVVALLMLVGETWGRTATILAKKRKTLCRLVCSSLNAYLEFFQFSEMTKNDELSQEF